LKSIYIYVLTIGADKGAKVCLLISFLSWQPWILITAFSITIPLKSLLDSLIFLVAAHYATSQPFSLCCLRIGNFLQGEEAANVRPTPDNFLSL
jgi:hypothetical protein